MRTRLSNLPARAAAGAFILNTGISKLSADKDTAAHLHHTATGPYPFLEQVPPERFARGLAIAELAVGGALLTPLVSDGLAGLALAGFSGALLRLYFKTPGLREEGSVRPTQQGTPLAKDVWLAGIAASLLASSLRPGHKSRRATRKANKRARADQD
jgi:hypothetical protein